jgi:hypothetical protein
VTRRLFVLAALWAGAACARAQAGPGFVFNGKPIHPGCLSEMRAFLSDSLPANVAVDLEGCGYGTNRHFGNVTTEKGLVSWKEEGKDEGHNGPPTFGYRYLGVLANGVHVVQTFESGGGSGIFESLLLLRFENDRAFEEDHYRPRPLLKLVGERSLGDRAETEIHLKGNEITIRAGKSGQKPEVTTIKVE